MNDTIRMLLVEDDAADAVLVQRSLEKCVGSYESETCSSLNDALQWLQTNSCNLVLLDRSLPDCFGTEGIEELHRHDPDLPIVMMTGFDDEASAISALEHGAQDYLVKGKATEQELERTIRHAIQRQLIQNENRRLVIELNKAARSDALTGVLNRHAMMSEFETHWRESIDNASPLSCIILDVDFFKRINDEYGHIAGDETLRQFAFVIGHATRPGDCLARYGGEEFCVILPNTVESEAAKWADNVRNALASFQFSMGGTTRQVTASFGVGQRCDSTESIEQLIDLADQALLRSKANGRNRVTSARDKEVATAEKSLVTKHTDSPHQPEQASSMAPICRSRNVVATKELFPSFGSIAISSS